MASVRTRYAPSPTGYLHVGGAWSAFFGWLFARHHGGTFVLRIDDTDTARSTEASLQEILSGFRWLGIDWDEGPETGGPYGPYRQSQRLPVYERAFRRLLEEGKLAELAGGGYSYLGKTTLLLAAEIAVLCGGREAHCVSILPGIREMQEFSSLMRRYIKNISLSSQKASLSMPE
ncbi:MAG: hypothetical protein K6U88_16440, partial [Dehalococcoidia bacterium]|nr:hypothetical protein [Dehalococcoidia bacterium]